VARDTELDRLKIAQDQAFQRKQDAWRAQDDAFKRLQATREAMDRAHEVRQRAYDAQEASWQEYQRIRSYNGPRIDDLNARQEVAFQAMSRAFDNASDAHNRRDGASARAYADEGHRHKADSRAAVDERRRLVAEIRAARDRHDATKPALQNAKYHFDQAKNEYNRTKADHEQKRDAYQRAKADFDQASRAFRVRLERVKAESNRRREDRRAIAERAGVPSQHLDDVWISTEPDGSVNIYFGGVGRANGPGHGHYAMDRYGTVTYRRDPFDPHGKNNFADDEAYVARKREEGHRGGFGRVWYGSVDGRPVTFALGWGTKEGETLLADGHVTDEAFWGHHDHYGKGQGPHANGTLRGAYTGPGA
jgi:hypothetical protein